MHNLSDRAQSCTSGIFLLMPHEVIKDPFQDLVKNIHHLEVKRAERMPGFSMLESIDASDMEDAVQKNNGSKFVRECLRF